MSEDEEDDPPRTLYPWEHELDRMVEERKARALREGKDEDYYLTPDPDKKLTVEDCFRYIRTAQSMPEVWDAFTNMYLPTDEEEAAGYEPSEEDDNRHVLSNWFDNWYRFKFHPDVNGSALFAPGAVIEMFSEGKIDDLFGDEAIAYLLESEYIQRGEK
ncbi:hypothetical protein [Hoeflea poritis]|uniref:Uncharacterized protein n=1 Tax=Hoeflea poritis TaxID=2993659 RepID=A0ABT4VJ38_9HYPH|nr:hypothetical protein [Hoeflea poritis]MDA4844043.1 hypothetical protein [Hoeflea poritis]